MKKVVIPMIALSIISIPPIDVVAIDENNRLETNYSEVNDNEQEQDREEIVNQAEDNEQEVQTDEIETDENNPVDTSQDEKIITYVNEATADKQVQVGNLKTTVNEDETEVRVELKDTDITGLGRDIRFAVWSEEGGQDDLRWYTATKDSKGNYVYNVKIKDHRTAGSYNVHCYMYGNDGSMTMLTKTTFDIVKKAEVTIQSFTSKDNGEFVMELATTTPNLISKIQVPTWRDSDQNDIVWYDAQKVNDTTYRVVMNIANHKHHIGQYNLHVYATLKNGIRHFTCANTQEVTVTNYTYIEKVRDRVYTLNIINPNGGNAQRVQIPTWSESNGQDDIIWYEASNNGGGLWSATLTTTNHKHAGRYFAHYYVTADNITQKVAENSFTVSQSEMLTGMDLRAQNYTSSTDKLILVDLTVSVK